VLAMVDAEMSIRLSARRCSRAALSGALVSVNGTEAGSLMSAPQLSRPSRVALPELSGAARSIGRGAAVNPAGHRYPVGADCGTSAWQALSQLAASYRKGAGHAKGTDRGHRSGPADPGGAGTVRAVAGGGRYCPAE